MSGMKGLNTALTALYAHQRAIETTAQNVANANTEGYTRQRVNTASVAAPATPAIHSRSVNEVGGGVQIISIERLHDVFLDQRANQENATGSSLTKTAQIMANVENAFAEPTDNGLAAQLGEFWNGWQDLANHPEDPAARTQLLQRASTLSDGVKKLDSDLVALRDSATGELKTTVNQVNSMAKQIGELNNAVRTANQNGLNANDLSDQRDLLVSKLAKLAGGTVRPGEYGTTDVYLGNQALVRGSEVNGIAAPTVDASGNVAVQWALDGSTVDFNGGEAQALRNAVNVTLSDTNPAGYRKKLADVANSIRSAVNTQHAAGRDLQTPSQAGGQFFTGTGADLTVNPAVLANPSLVAAASATGGQYDGTNADAIADLAAAPGGPDQLYSALVVGLGVEADTINRRSAIQADVVEQADAAKQSASGVNLDEEMANLVSYQHAYSAAARVLTAVDEMLQELINSTGRVGL
jgi:flagellar hook-associated protein 1 FlgK